MSRRLEGSRRDPVLLGCLVVALAPFVVGVVRVLFVHWTPVGDWALLELRSRNVGGSHTPLVGPYSRFGWSHPGPLLFYVLAIPYRLLGSRPSGMLLAALLVNGASVAGIVLLAGRRGGRVLLVAATIAVVLLCRALGADFLRDPWNPNLTVLPFAVLIFLAWSIMCADTWMLPVAVVVASFVVQSHIGYAAMVGVVLGGAIAWRLIAVVRQRIAGVDAHPRRAAAIVGVTVALAALAWLPSAVDQARDGNLRAIYNFFRRPQPTPSLDTALRVVGRALTFPGAWISGYEGVRTSDFTSVASGVFVPLALLALLAGLVVTVRRRDGDAAALLALVAAVLLAGVYSVSHISGPLAAYLVRWLLVLGMLSWLAAAWTLWPVLSRVRLDRSARGARVALVGAVIAAAVVPAAMSVDDAVRDRGPWYRVGLVERDLARETVAHLSRDGHPVLLESRDEHWFTWGLAPRLEAAGIAVAARPSDALYFGRHRAGLARDARFAVVVVVGAGARTSGRPAGGRLLASYAGRGSVPSLPPTTSYRSSIESAEQGLLAETVAVYEVRR
jgi:hypothetical protein